MAPKPRSQPNGRNPGWMAAEPGGGKRPRAKAMHQARRAAGPDWSSSEAQGDIPPRRQN